MVNQDEKIIPVEGNGVGVMSLGFLLDADTPVIWRGPMVMKAIEQFLGDVDWGDARLPGRRPAAGHRRRPAHAHPEGPARRRGDRHHAAGRRAHRRPQGAADVPQGQRPGARHRREHVDLRLPAVRPPRGDLQVAAAAAAPRDELGVPFLGEIPLDPRSCRRRRRLPDRRRPPRLVRPPRRSWRLPARGRVTSTAAEPRRNHVAAARWAAVALW